MSCQGKLPLLSLFDRKEIFVTLTDFSTFIRCLKSPERLCVHHSCLVGQRVLSVLTSLPVMCAGISTTSELEGHPLVEGELTQNAGNAVCKE